MKRLMPKNFHIANQPGMQVIETPRLRIDGINFRHLPAMQDSPAGKSQHQNLIRLTHPKRWMIDRMVKFITTDQIWNDVPFQFTSH